MAPTLLAVPNVSEGRDGVCIEAIGEAISAGVSLLDRHSDADHNRTVFTLAGEPEALVDALAAGAAAAIESIDMAAHEGLHPAIGALDVCPIVWLDPGERDAARAAAGDVAGADRRPRRPRLPLRRARDRARPRPSGPISATAGLAELWLRMEGGELRPDQGPELPHRSAGATLVTARPPLAAFNVELDSGDVEIAKAVAAGMRESGGGPAGVRAIGLALSSGRVQVSTNVHDPLAVPLGRVVELVRELAAPLGAVPLEAELIGLIPAAALAGYPDDVPIRGLDPARDTIEGRLGGAA